VPEFFREPKAGTPRIRLIRPLARRARRVVCSPGSRRSNRFVALVMRSSSQWPGTMRVVTSASCSVTGIMFGCGRANQFAEADAGWPCRPVAGRPVAKRRQTLLDYKSPALKGVVLYSDERHGSRLAPDWKAKCCCLRCVKLMVSYSSIHNDLSE
jgi:hypothetical protein